MGMGPAEAGDPHARGRGAGARPRAWGVERAAASGGAWWRGAFPATVAHKPKVERVREME